MMIRTHLLAFFLMATQVLSAVNYTFEWNTPFPNQFGSNGYHASYAVGPKNIHFSYAEEVFQAGYPNIKATDYGFGLKERLALLKQSGQSAEFIFQLEETQSTNSNPPLSISFLLHGIDVSNAVSVFGIDGNGNSFTPQYIAQGFNPSFSINPSAPHLIATGGVVGPNSNNGSVLVLFNAPVETVIIEFENLGFDIDNEIILDDIDLDLALDHYIILNNFGVLDWGINNHLPGSLNHIHVPNSNSPVQMHFVITGETGSLVSGYPADNANLGNFGGFPSTEALIINMDPAAQGNSLINVDIGFTMPLDEVHFSIADIDNTLFLNSFNKIQNSAVDEISITGYLNGNVVLPYIHSHAGGASFTLQGNVATGQQFLQYNATGGLGERGTLNVYFPSTIDHITISYQNQGKEGFPWTREIGIGNIYFLDSPEPNKLEGSVFNDLNSNGLWDPAEVGLANVEIHLFRDENFDQVPDYLIGQTLTGDGFTDYDGDGIPEPLGMYKFKGPIEGAYVLQVSTLPEDCEYIQTADPDGFLDHETYLTVANVNLNYLVKHFGYHCEGESGEKPREYRSDTRVAEELYDSDLKIYPNPVAEHLFYHNPFKSGESTIKILDPGGHQILMRQMESQQNGSLSLSHLPSGIYLVVVEQGTKFSSRRFIKN